MPRIPQTYKDNGNKDELVSKLMKTISINLIILTVIIISVIFFAPKIGSFFGIFSKYRNSADDTALIKPNPPILSNIPYATKENKLNITGYAQPGMTVKLFTNGPESGQTIVSADGIFNFSDISLIDGRNTIFAKAIDSYQSESDKSQTFVILVDKSKPKLEIDSPGDGDTIRNLDKRVTITGKLNEKCTVLINERLAVLKPDFTFEFLLGVSEGENKIKVKAIDEAGNESEKEFKITYVRDN